MKRVAVAVGIPLLSAIFLILVLPDFKGVWATAIITAVIVIVALLGVAVFKRKDAKRLLCVLFSLVGVAACLIKLASTPDFSAYYGKTLSFVGEIVEIRNYDDGADYIVSMPYNDRTVKTIVKCVTEEEFSVGDTLVGAGFLSEVETKDYELDYNKSNNIFLRIVCGENILLLQKGKGSLFNQINLTLKETADKVFSPASSAIVKAVLLGDGSEISPQIKYFASRSGIRHIFVVSGMHISLLGMIAAAILKRTGLKRQSCSLITLAFIWFAIIITGGNPPAVRAGIMMTVVIAAGLFRRRADGLNSLFIAGILIGLINPYIIASASFLLSFSATAGIITLSHPIEKLLGARSKAAAYLISAFSVSAAANIAMLPLSFWLFKGISLFSALTNLLVVPLLPVILVLSAASLLFSSMPHIAAALGLMTELAIKAVTAVSEIVGGFRFAYIGLDYDFILLLAGVAVLLGLVGFWLFKDIKAVKAVVSAMVVILAASTLLQTALSADRVKIYVSGGEYSKGVILTYHGMTVALDFTGTQASRSNLLSTLQGKNRYQISYYFDFGKNEVGDYLPISYFYSDKMLENEYILFSDERVTVSYKPHALYVTVGDKTAVITNDFESVEKTKFNYLIIDEEYDKNIEHFYSECAILLKRPPLERLISDGRINGYSENPEITI